MKIKLTPARIARIALIAGLYAALTLLPPFSSFSYYHIQIRVSEALTVLPYITPLAIPGLFIGCVLSNLASPFFIWDVTLGSLATLLAAYLTSLMPTPYLALLPPIMINATIVGGYVSALSKIPYHVGVASIALGEVIACVGLGYPLLLYILRRPNLRKFLDGREE